jgi:hypothetical protein
MLRAALFTSALLFLAGASTAVEDDPIPSTLKKAKTEYAAEMAKATTEMVNQWLAREKAARREGSKQKLDAIKAERKSFEETGDWPSGMDAVEKMRAAANRRIEAAYKTAITKYTKAGDDEKAAAVEKEFNQFWTEKFFPPGQYAVRYGGGNPGATTELREDGSFVRIREGQEPDTGKYTYSDGKLIQKCNAYVEVWARKDGVIHLDLYYPAATYPRGRVDTTGEVKLVKRTEKKK